jgi:hypothetical protein
MVDLGSGAERFAYVAERQIDGSRGIYSPEIVGLLPIVTYVTNESVTL